jgi:hypothetical protein
MMHCNLRRAAWTATAMGAAVLWTALTNQPAQCDSWLFPRRASSCETCGPMPAQEVVSKPTTSATDKPAETPKKPEPAVANALTDASLTTERSAATGGEQLGFATPNMIGDVLIGGTGGFRRDRSQRDFNLPSTSRNFKIADNQNVEPQDRLILNFNYYNNVNDEMNLRTGASAGTVDAHRETFGFEKTFLDRSASIAVLLPLNSLNADGGATGGGASSTALGDLTFVGKFNLLGSREGGSLLTGGLALTVPSGSGSFAGVDHVSGSFHSTLLTPWLGFLLTEGNFYIHGFSSVEVPMDTTDVTLLYNDLGIGYVVYRDGVRQGRISAVAPTLEVHVNTPMTHPGAFTAPAGVADSVTITEAVTLEFRHGSSMAIGFNQPITGLKAYDLEGIIQFNYRY